MSPNVPRAVEGTNDFHGLSAVRFDLVIRLAGEIFAGHGYERIHTPLLEPTDLFARSLGAATDIVEKEMYTFAPGPGSVTLRPEGTAGVARAYLQRNLAADGRLAKLWYGGPMFRRERPQKGRYRQFHQVGVEAIGSADPLLDAETILMGLRLYRALGIEGVGLRLNSIGCPRPDCRPEYRRILREAIAPRLSGFCQNCQARFARNPLRILDCKRPACRELAKDLPRSAEHLCAECAGHFEAVVEALAAGGAQPAVDGTLVRGLDYYTKTVFEYTHGALGAQDALGGGGRYDGLAEELGGAPAPAVGLALGVERMLLAMEAGGRACSCRVPLMVFGVATGEAARRGLTGLLARLREAGLSADMDYEGRSFKSQMRQANRRGALLCLILGEDELAGGFATLKDLREGGGQARVPLDEFVQAASDAIHNRRPPA